MTLKWAQRAVAAVIAAAVIVVLTTSVSFAQPTGGDATAVLEDWAKQASGTDVLSETYDIADMGFGANWHGVYIPGQSVYEGTAVAPYMDDLVVDTGHWVTSVYSLGVIAGAVDAYQSGGYWMTYRYWDADTGIAVDAMGGTDKFLVVPIAQGQWVVHSDESVTPAGGAADRITPGGGTLADIVSRIQGQAVQDPNLAGGGGGMSTTMDSVPEDNSGIKQAVVAILLVTIGLAAVVWRRSGAL